MVHVAALFPVGRQQRLFPLGFDLPMGVHTPVVEGDGQVVFRVIQAGVVEIQQGADLPVFP